MSKVFPVALGRALRNIYDIVVDLVGNPAYLWRVQSQTFNSYSQEQRVYSDTHEEIVCYFKFSDLPRLFSGILYDEDDLPIMAYFKNSDNIQPGDKVRIFIEGKDEVDREYDYMVADPIGKVTSHMEIYDLYKMIPWRVADPCPAP